MCVLVLATSAEPPLPEYLPCRLQCRLQFVAFLYMLIDETHQIVEAAIALILFDALAVDVQENGRITVDALVAAQALRLGAVHLGHFDGGAGILDGQIVPGGRHALAVAAPRRKELDNRHARCGGVLEAVLGQFEDASVSRLGGGLLRFLGLDLADALFDELFELFDFAGPAVLLLLLAVNDPQQGWVALDLVLLAQRTGLGAVDARNRHGRVVFQGVGQFFPDRFEALWVQWWKISDLGGFSGVFEFRLPCNVRTMAHRI